MVVLEERECECSIGIDVGGGVEFVPEELLDVVTGVARPVAATEVHRDSVAAADVDHSEGGARDWIGASAKLALMAKLDD